MMDQQKWDALYKAFQEEEPFWESRFADESEFDGLNLFNWLNCDNQQPAIEMRNEFAQHGYDVFCVERGSFGWLIGGVKRHLDPSGKVITFG